MLERRFSVPPVEMEVPPHIKHSLDRYAADGTETGGFLRAVLENNLKQAVGQADSYNQILLCAIVSYCYNHLPSACWGSEEAVSKWLEKKREALVNNITEGDG